MSGPSVTFEPPEGFSKAGPVGAEYSFVVCNICGGAILVTLPGGFESAARHRVYHALAAPSPKGVVLK